MHNFVKQIHSNAEGNSGFWNQVKFSRELNFLFLSILLFAAAFGINLVTFPTILTKQGVDPAHVGLAFTCDMLGGITMSFFLSRFVAKFGMLRSLKFAALLYASAILLIYFYQGFLLWIFFAFIMGACWFVYMITRQAWLNILLENHQRGVAIGIFSMVISAGLALGPVIVSFSGADDYRSFIISSMLVICSFALLRPLRKATPPQVESQVVHLRDFYKTNPCAFLARFFLDFQTYLLATFTVIFGTKIGLSYEAAGLLISAYMASGFFDVIVGFLLKRTSPYKLINIGFLGCMYCFLIIILYNKSYPFLLLLYFLFGMCIACIYVSVFKLTNEDYGKEKLVAANSAFQLIGSLGALFGALSGGFLVNIFGTNGFPIAMVLSSILYITFLIIHDKKNCN